MKKELEMTHLKSFLTGISFNRQEFISCLLSYVHKCMFYGRNNSNFFVNYNCRNKIFPQLIFETDFFL